MYVGSLTLWFVVWWIGGLSFADGVGVVLG